MLLSWVGLASSLRSFMMLQSSYSWVQSQLRVWLRGFIRIQFLTSGCSEALRFSWTQLLSTEVSPWCSSHHGNRLTSEQVREKEDLRWQPRFCSLLLELISAIFYSLEGLANIQRKGITQGNVYQEARTIRGCLKCCLLQMDSVLRALPFIFTVNNFALFILNHLLL